VTDEIRKLEDRRYQAMLDGDVAVLDDLLATELVYTHSNAESDSKASYLDKVGRGVFRYFDIARLEEEILVLGDTAIVTGRMVARIEAGGTMRHLNNRFAAVWVLRNGRWTLVIYQPTPIPA